MELSKILQNARDAFLGTHSENLSESIEKSKSDETLEFFLNAMEKKESVSIVFTTLKEDGTLVCDGAFVTIEMAPYGDDVRRMTYAERMNRRWEVRVTSVDRKNGKVKVERVSSRPEYRTQVISELKKVVNSAREYIRENNRDYIENYKDQIYIKRCADLDEDKDSAVIKAIMDGAEARAVTDLIENFATSGYKKQIDDEPLTYEEELVVTQLIVPAKVYNCVPIKPGAEEHKVGVDLLGLHITGDVYARSWMDRINSPSIMKMDAAGMSGEIIQVVVCEYNPRFDNFICSRKALQFSQWQAVERHLHVGDLVQVRAMDVYDGYYIGVLTGSFGGGNVDPYSGLVIRCDFPTSRNAIENNVAISSGNVYVCKIRVVDREKKFINAKTIRNAGKWEKKKGE